MLSNIRCPNADLGIHLICFWNKDPHYMHHLPPMSGELIVYTDRTKSIYNNFKLPYSKIKQLVQVIHKTH